MRRTKQPTASRSLSMMASNSSKCLSFISSFFICVSTSRATRLFILRSSTDAKCCRASHNSHKSTVSQQRAKFFFFCLQCQVVIIILYNTQDDIYSAIIYSTKPCARVHFIIIIIIISQVLFIVTLSC